MQDYSELFADNKFDLAVDCLPGGYRRDWTICACGGLDTECVDWPATTVKPAAQHGCITEAQHTAAFRLLRFLPVLVQPVHVHVRLCLYYLRP